MNQYSKVSILSLKTCQQTNTKWNTIKTRSPLACLLWTYACSSVELLSTWVMAHLLGGA